MSRVIRRKTRTYKIEKLENVPLEGSVILQDNQLMTNTQNALTFPDVGGLVLTSEAMSGIKTNVDRLVDYLEGWALAGNITMGDIKQYVNTNENEYQLTCTAVVGTIYTFRIDKATLGSTFHSIQATRSENGVDFDDDLDVEFTDDNTITFDVEGHDVQSLRVVYHDVEENEVKFPLNTALNSISSYNTPAPEPIISETNPTEPQAPINVHADDEVLISIQCLGQGDESAYIYRIVQKQEGTGTFDWVFQRNSDGLMSPLRPTDMEEDTALAFPAAEGKAFVLVVDSRSYIGSKNRLFDFPVLLELPTTQNASVSLTYGQVRRATDDSIALYVGRYAPSLNTRFFTYNYLSVAQEIKVSRLVYQPPEGDPVTYTLRDADSSTIGPTGFNAILPEEVLTHADNVNLTAYFKVDRVTEERAVPLVANGITVLTYGDFRSSDQENTETKVTQK